MHSGIDVIVRIMDWKILAMLIYQYITIYYILIIFYIFQDLLYEM